MAARAARPMHKFVGGSHGSSLWHLALPVSGRQGNRLLPARFWRLRFMARDGTAHGDCSITACVREPRSSAGAHAAMAHRVFVATCAGRNRHCHAKAQQERHPKTDSTC